MDISVIKRDGTKEPLDREKILNGIMKSAMEVGGHDQNLADLITNQIENSINQKCDENGCITAEQIQNIVEKELIEGGYAKTAKQFILKSADRNRMREMNTSLMKEYEEITFASEAESEVKRENANIDSSTAMGTMLKYGSEGAKSFNLLYMMSQDIADAHRRGDIHIHDLDFLSLTATCDHIPLDRLFKDGFNTGHGYLREPGKIGTAANLAAIAIQSNQNDMHGGQSIPLLDYYLAPYVALSYVRNIADIASVRLDLTKDQYKELKNRLVYYRDNAENQRVMNEKCKKDISELMYQFIDEYNLDYNENTVSRILEKAYEWTNNDTYQAMEAFIHNLNTMHCLPESEKIWVLNVKTNEFRSITMGELNDTFEQNKYKVISLNKETGKAEFKFITNCAKLNNNRNIVTIEDNQGRKVRVTDNHRVMTIDGLDITESIPSECDYTISPRGIKFPAAKYDFCVSDYGNPRSDNPFKNDHVLLTEQFAEFIGYYIGDGCILGQTSTCCISACGKVSFKYMEQLLKDTFGCELKTSYTYFNHSKNGVTEKDIRIQLGMPLARMIADKFGRVGKEKKIPTELMFASDDIKKAFLKAYFKMDGRSDRNYSELSTVNKELQAQIALMISSISGSCHYTTRNCKNGFSGERDRLDMHFLTISGHDSAMIGLKDSDKTAFDIPKYSLQNVYNKYKSECDEISARRHSKNIRYSELEELIEDYGVEDVKKFTNIFVNKIENKEECISDEYVYDISVADNENFLTYECIYVHNSRAGAQVPFSSVNYGTDTSTEGRMIMNNLLDATEAGLGNGETAIFPVQIFKLKDGVSHLKGDPNYDLYLKACRVSALRMYPNFVNLDAPYNAELYVPGNIETEMATMGCVEGSEMIEYTISGSLYIESFKRAYERLSKLSDSKIYSAKSEYLDLTGLDVRVRDSANNTFTKVKKIIRNKEVDNWRQVKLKSESGSSIVLTATSNHPLPVNDKGRTYVADLESGDRINLAKKVNSNTSDTKFKSQYFGENTWLLGIMFNSKILKDSQGIVVELDDSEKDLIKEVTKAAKKLGYTTVLKEVPKKTGIITKVLINTPSGAYEELKELFTEVGRYKTILTSRLLTSRRELRVKLLAGLLERGKTLGFRTNRSLKGIYSGQCFFRLESSNKEQALTMMSLVTGLGYNTVVHMNTGKISKKFTVEFGISGEVLDNMKSSTKLSIIKHYERARFDPDRVLTVESVTTDELTRTEDSYYSYDMETDSDRLDISLVQSHNCRTRVGKNVHDPSKSVIPGRGNLSFTSINLPRLGIEAHGDINKFYESLDKMMDLVHRQLLERFEVQCKKHPRNYPFLMGQGNWVGSENLGPDDDIREILSNGTFGVGFIGLAETLVALTGKHHGESEESQKLGLEIIGHMRELTDKWSDEEKMNYGVIGTPAEGLSGRFIRLDKKRYGIIPGVTDRDYYTNSSHVPVYYPISATRKVDIEAPYHFLESGGHILYIEMDGDPTKNLKAFKKIVDYMHDKGAGYMAVNHPLDYDPVCKYSGIITDVCPRCGRREGEPMTLEMWNKIKGYANAGNFETLGYHGDTYEEKDRMINPLD